MQILWITGLPGAGKSTLAKRLAAHLPTQDADLDGFSRWRYKATGQWAPIDAPSGRSGQEWALDLDVVRSWRERPEPVGLLLGAIANEPEVLAAGLFDGLVLIDVPMDQLAHRMRSRPEGYGKQPGEIEAMVELSATYRNRYEELGASIVRNEDGQDCLPDLLRLAARVLRREQVPPNG